MEKKFLRVSMKMLFASMAIVLALVFAMLTGMFCVSGFDFDLFYDKNVITFITISALVMCGFIAVYTYQYYNNVLEYGNYGFAVGGITYYYRQATKLVAVHRRKHGTYYHLYVDDEVVFRFSRMYENKDDFIELLQKNGVLIVA